jgi:alkylation response protein AidB-like acyl-CoA dehydrogenase
VAWANEAGRASDPHVRRTLAELRVQYEAARLVNYRAVSLQATGAVPTTEASVARIHNGLLEQRVSHAGLELLGPLAQLDADDPWAPLAGVLRRYWARNIPTTIAAGTLEIQKNVVAQRGLGLPRPV